jgi:integrase
MACQTKGSFEARVLADGSRAFHLRFQFNRKRECLVLHERPNCGCGCGGGWEEMAARTELGDVLARVRAGVWERPKAPRGLARFGGPRHAPTFSEYAAWWLQAKRAGILGDRAISENTLRHYRVCVRHLEAYLGPHPLSRIDADACFELKAHLVEGARVLRRRIAAGQVSRDDRGNALRPLGAATIRTTLNILATILEEAVEDRHLSANPARGRRMAVKVPKPRCAFLEAEELAYLLAAAADQDRPFSLDRHPEPSGATATAVAELAAEWLDPAQIAERLGISAQAVSFHLRRLGARTGRGYVGRRMICEMLGRSGLRVSELCNARIADVRAYGPGAGRIQVPRSKTEAGRRVVELTPALTEVVRTHFERLRALRRPSSPEAYLVPNLRNGRLSPARAGQVVAEAARLASERLVAKGRPPLPHTTPHTLRRTYISMALLANGFDVKFVMSQVGHVDSTMTLDVYARLAQRARRSHGTSFDRLIAEAEAGADSLSALGPGPTQLPLSPPPARWARRGPRWSSR